MHGFLVVNKPRGVTSHDVVARVRRVLRERRVGHGGTLDPNAEGVLPLAIGKATRLLPYVRIEPKQYVFDLALGIETTTQDSDGETVSQRDASEITEDRVAQVLSEFQGDILQTPPMFSAVHHQGRRLYELAREGKEVEREPRQVTVYRFELESFRPGQVAIARCVCDCTSGTYVRTLCHDVGRRLGVGGHLGWLVRTKCGVFDISQALPLEKIEASTTLLESSEVLSELDRFTPSLAGLDRILHGNPLRPARHPETRYVRVLDERGLLVALAEWRPPFLQPVVVLHDPSLA